MPSLVNNPLAEYSCSSSVTSESTVSAPVPLVTVKYDGRTYLNPSKETLDRIARLKAVAKSIQAGTLTGAVSPAIEASMPTATPPIGSRTETTRLVHTYI